MTSDHKALQNTDIDTPSNRTIDCLLKYIKRGFDFLNDASEWDEKHECRRSPYCGRAMRGVDDSATMRVGFTGDLMAKNDLIDEKMIWILASKQPCKQSDRVSHTRGFVGSTNYAATGEQISLTVDLY